MIISNRILLLVSLLTIAVETRAQSSVTVIASSAFTHALSPHGSYVVGAKQDGSPFLWSPSTGFVPNVAVMSALAVSDNGVIVGTNGHACSWSASTGLVDLGVLPGETSSTATGVSSDGSVIVGVSGKSVFRWTEQSGMSLIASTSPSNNTVAVAGDCSADGSSFVGGINGRPFIWKSGSGLSFPVPWSGFFRHVSPDGSRVTGDVTDVFYKEGVMVSGGRVTYIGNSAFPVTSFISVENGGSFGVANVTLQGVTTAYLWSREGYLGKLQDYLVNSGASTAAGYTRLRSAILSADGASIGCVATDANGNDNAVYATLTVPAPTGPLLQDIFASPASRVGSNNVDIIAQLTGPAPSGGAKLPLKSSSANITPRSTALVGGAGIYVPAGATQAVNYATTTAVDARGSAYVRGTYLGESRIATLELNPATLYDPTISSPVATGGSSVTCNLMLNGLAASTATISVSSSNSSAASVPPTVTIAPGANKTNFTIQTHSVVVPQTVTISVSYRAITKSVNLTVVP